MSETKDAARYRYLRELMRTDRVKAQAFFWMYSSRKDLDRAIDDAMLEAAGLDHAGAK